MKLKSRFLIIGLMLNILYLAGLSLPVKAESIPLITLSPVSGIPGTAIAITGSGFTPKVSGNIWLDSNNNGIKDIGEPSRNISTTAAGEFPKFTRLTVPQAPGGQYKILADIPGGEKIEASADFTILPAINLSQKTGYSGTAVTISGSGFAANTSGYIWFDTNKNGQREDSEVQVKVTTDVSGAIPSDIAFTTPSAGPGDYAVQAAIPDGEQFKASAEFTYTPTIVISPSPVTSNLGSVVMDTVITISVSGGGFTPNASGHIWFDNNKNGQRDADESQTVVNITNTGAIPAGISLTTPKLPPCSSFNVLADVPEDGNIDATGILDVAETTTSVTITKHDPYGNTIATKTVSWEWMKDNLPVIGDGKTDYYIQKGTALSDTFEHVWDPEETDLDPDTLLEMGYARGSDVKDLCNLVGGATEGDMVLFTASDNWQTRFDYENIYFPDPRQGKVVLSWWNGSSGGYVPEFYLGMRLYCFAETTNTEGMHLYGDWDMHETLAPSLWEYSPIGPCTSRLSNKYVRYIDIYEPNLYPCDAAGKVKSDFAAGETVYVKGLGLAENISYKLWIQPEGVQISPLDDLGLRNGDYVFSKANDPSGVQETVTTDSRGDFAPAAIWKIDASILKKYDIVADNLSSGTMGTFDTQDAISNKGAEGFKAPSEAAAGAAPETLIGVIIVVFVIIAILIALYVIKRRSRVSSWYRDIIGRESLK